MGASEKQGVPLWWRRDRGREEGEKYGEGNRQRAQLSDQAAQEGWRMLELRLWGLSGAWFPASETQGTLRCPTRRSAEVHLGLPSCLLGSAGWLQKGAGLRLQVGEGSSLTSGTEKAEAGTHQPPCPLP